MKLSFSPDLGFSLFFLSLAMSAGTSFAQPVIVNGASFDSTAPIPPGSFATAFGQNLCGQTATGQLNASGQYPTTLGGCSITISGIPAMLTYVSPGQMNLIVPQNAGMGMLLGTTWQMGPFSTTTNGQPTPVSLFLTGMDLSVAPSVMVGGMPAQVTFYGAAPGYPGLQQINFTLPANMAGVGRVPVTVSSNGQTSNVTYMSILPTTAMMQGMPGWNSGMMVGEDMPRAAEMSSVAVNPSNNTVLVTDEAGDALRVISLSSNATVATIALPAGSQAGSVAVNSTGTMAAVALTEKGSIALIDLTQNQVSSVIGTGYYTCRLVFSGTSLLVTNGASGTVTVIDTNIRQVTSTVNVGFGPAGIAVSGNTAVVANMQAGSISLVNLTDYSVVTISLPAGSRPGEVAISTAANKALITNPMGNNAFLLALDTHQVTQVNLAAASGMGPGGVAVNGSLALVADQMTASVAVLDMNAGTVVKTFPVDPGPRALAVNAAKNQLLVLCQGTGTLDLVDLTSYAVTGRINATSGTASGNWILPSIASLTPNTAKIGSSFTLTISGSNLQGVTGLGFRAFGTGMGGGMMGGGGSSASDDPNIQVTNVSANAAGTQITASVQILPAATAGTRQIRLGTSHGDMMGPLNSAVFTVTQ
jgi:YVTN family beta-propeller protein